MGGTFGAKKQNRREYNNKVYTPNLKEGQEYQDFIAEYLYKMGLPLFNYASEKYQKTKGENKLGVEIKYNRKLGKTGNLYIETDEKSNPNNRDFVPSGINRNDNTWLWVTGTKRIAFIFSKRMLHLIEPKYRHVETPTSKGFLIPEKDARKFAAKILDFSEEKDKNS